MTRIASPVPVLLVLGLVAGAAAAPAPAHELHETYADLAIEGGVVAGRIQFFKRDLEAALGPRVGADAITLTPGPEADALVLGYLRDRLRLEAAGKALEASLLRAEEIRLGHHPGWEVTLAWEATSPIGDLRIRNTLLFERHDDQRNVMRFVRFPEATRETVTTEPGSADVVVADRVPSGTGR